MAITPSLDIDPPLNVDPEGFRAEAYAIADWWLDYAQDLQNGGFYGQVAWDNRPVVDAQKCIILNARILWFFSEFSRFSDAAIYRAGAQRAYQYLCQHFMDGEYGGVFWMLDAEGQVVHGHKQTYGQAFTIYALCAYYDLTGESAVLESALEYFTLLEEHAADPVYGGYFEAFSRDWGPLEDVRLSEKEDNFPRTMNTHLHILEAYTALHNSVRAAEGHVRQQEVAQALQNVLALYCERVVDLESGHVRMFMEENWQDRTRLYSFGHDIESSWLIDKASSSLAAAGISTDAYQIAVQRLAEVALRDGLQANGTMGDEYDPISAAFCHGAWWVQVEAMVGFTYRWKQGAGRAYWDAAQSIWQQVQKNYIDHEYGEWHWFSVADVPPEQSEYKVGAWKAPYHSGRAMMLMYQWLSDR